jgi:hypothetical protein
MAIYDTLVCVLASKGNLFQEGCVMKRSLCIIFCGVCSCLAFGYDWATNPGDGTPENPYQISEPNQLIAIGSDPVLLDKYFILTGDIVFDPSRNPAHVFTTSLIAQTAPFTGCFDGQGHTISNLRIASPYGIGYLGLFRYIQSPPGLPGSLPVIKNLTLTDPNITTDSNEEVGCLVGRTEYGSIYNCRIVTGFINGGTSCNIAGLLTGSNYYGTISNCHTSGILLNGYSELGGLVGRNRTGTISNCSTYCELDNGYSYIGGLAGHNYYGTITGSSAKCYITGKDYSYFIGGLAGGNTEGIISHSSAEGFVEGHHDCGGLAGYCLNGSISLCHADTFCRGTMNIGGFIGNNDSGAVLNCYAENSVIGTSGSSNLGGFIGDNSNMPGNNGVIVHSYSRGQVYAEGSSSRQGGFIGKNTNGSLENCYFLDTAGPDNGYGTPLTQTQMKQKANFVNWDFLGETANGSNEIWRMCADSVSYPRLSWEYATSGDFACADGVTMDDLLALAAQWLTDYALTPTTFNYACDANRDDGIDMADLSILSRNWPGE